MLMNSAVVLRGTISWVQTTTRALVIPSSNAGVRLCHLNVAEHLILAGGLGYKRV